MRIVLNISNCRSNVPVHPLLEDLWDRQLGFSRRATGLLECASLVAAN